MSKHLVSGCKGCEHTNIALGTKDKDLFNSLRELALSKYLGVINYYNQEMSQIQTQISENNAMIIANEDKINQIKMDRTVKIDGMNKSNSEYDKWNNAVSICTKYDEFCATITGTDALHLSDKIEYMKSEYDKINDRIKNTKIVVQSKQTEVFRLESKLSKMKSADGVLSTITSHINDLEIELNELVNSDQTQLILEMEAEVSKLTDIYTSVLTTQVQYAEEMQRMKRELSDIQNKYNIINMGEYSDLKHKYNTFLDNMSDVIKFDVQVAVLAAYRLLLHPKNGIGAKLLETAVSDITYQLESALLSMEANFTFEFTSEYELSLIDRVTKMSVPPSLGSGYQQFVLALAVRWAISKVAKIPLPACFMIDEGFGCLDDVNLPKVVEALSILALQETPGSVKPIMIAVTHREDMDPYFSERLRIHTHIIPSDIDEWDYISYECIM